MKVLPDIFRHIVPAIPLFLLGLPLSAQNSASGKIVDDKTGEPVAGAVVRLPGTRIWTVSDTLGIFSLRMTVQSAPAEVEISSLGYRTLKARFLPNATYRLHFHSYSIDEVVVTATEGRGLTSTSRIGQDAIAHIQPSSFADLLELLPGGRAVDPFFGAPQTINLRSAGGYSSTSALGTKFMVDGAPQENDANLQSTPAFSLLGASYVNRGTDMRTLATEDIESVEIVRGIPSVEYGELTSGLVNIKRRKGGNDLHARFKGDMSSKLFYVGKGFEWGGKEKVTLNASLNYLDARNDPRDVRQGYKRLTGSCRVGKIREGTRYRCEWNGAVDYTGSFDDEKSDKDLDFGSKGPIETYRSSYNRFAASADFSASAKEKKAFLRSLSLHASASCADDLIDRWKYFAMSVPTPVSASLVPGVSDALIIPSSYETTLLVEGRPFYANVRSKASFARKTAGFVHRFCAGTEWNMEKNYGRGVIFDVTRPFTLDMNVRPRAHNVLPARHKLSAYAEYDLCWTWNGFRLESMAGARISAMANMGKEYDLCRKPHVDPRLNLRVDFPAAILGGRKLESAVFGGAGMHTKVPTMGQLFPMPYYGDVEQLNYWPVEENLRRVNLLVYKTDPTNFHLLPAHNFKWEIGMDCAWNGFNLSVDYFLEDMRSGFRSSSDYRRVIAKDYDEKAIDKSTLSAPPSLEGLPFRHDTSLVSYSFITNGSRNAKEGVEFTLSSARIKPLRTKVTISGAWFRTRYTNSEPEYYRPAVILHGKLFPYVGRYDMTEGTLYEYFNTNFLFDTQLPRHGLIFSTSFQCLWFTTKGALSRNPWPASYIDKNLVSRPFTEKDKANGVLSHLERDFPQAFYEKETVPFSLNVNLKIMKKLYRDKIFCSLFVNKLLGVNRSYWRHGVMVRRKMKPYFGMEITFKL